MSANFIHVALYLLRLPHIVRGKRYRFQRISDLMNRLRIAVLLMLFSLAVGTLGYVIIEDYPWFDAYYMSIITLASVGFGEVHPLSTAGRVFTSFLILFNVGLFAYSISTITSIFAEGGIFKLLHEFGMVQKISALNGHTIICGFGRHATEVSQELAKQGIPFVVVENKPEKMETLRNETGYLFVEGDATQDDVLEEAGIRRAASIVITLPHDADNLFITLTARQINPSLRIISRASNKADEGKIRKAGADQTVVPERIGGFYMATLVNKPDLVEFFTLLSNMGPGNVVFEEVPVSKLRPGFQYQTIAASGLPDKSRAAIVAVRRPDGQYELNPLHTTVLEPDSYIVMLGNPEQMNEFRKNTLAP